MSPAPERPQGGSRPVVGREQFCKINPIQQHNSFAVAVLCCLVAIALVGLLVAWLMIDERAQRHEAIDRMREAAASVEQYIEDRE